MQFQQLAGKDAYRHPILGDIEPRVGSLPLSVPRTLVGLLGRWIEESEPCCFAMWDGNGTWWKGSHSGEDRFDEERDMVLRQTPSVLTQHWDYFLVPAQELGEGLCHGVTASYMAKVERAPAGVERVEGAKIWRGARVHR